MFPTLNKSWSSSIRELSYPPLCPPVCSRCHPCELRWTWRWRRRRVWRSFRRIWRTIFAKTSNGRKASVLLVSRCTPPRLSSPHSHSDPPHALVRWGTPSTGMRTRRCFLYINFQAKSTCAQKTCIAENHNVQKIWRKPYCVQKTRRKTLNVSRKHASQSSEHIQWWFWTHPLWDTKHLQVTFLYYVCNVDA